MRKWLLRILIAVVSLVILLAIAVQAVLWSSLPQKWVLGAIQEKLQLRVAANGLSTGWGGNTSLSAVTLGLPLTQESFLQTQQLTVEHTGLLKLILGQDLRVERITIRAPDLLVRQSADGRWNIEEVAELIRRAGGGKSADAGTVSQASHPQLPEVVVTDARVRLIDNHARQATLQPVSFHGKPDGPLAWSFDAAVADHLTLKGEVAPGADWQHRADIRIANVHPLIRPFLVGSSPATLEAVQTFEVAAQWTGRIDGNLRGRLDIDKLLLAGYRARGPVNVAFDADGNGLTTLAPAGVVINSIAPDKIPPARAAAGVVSLDGRSVTLSALSLAIAGGEIRLNGSYAWNAGQGKLDAVWNKLIVPAGTLHSGALSVSLRQPWPNQPVIDATLDAEGTYGADAVSGKLQLSGVGTAWDHIDWKLTAPTLRYRQPKAVANLDNLAVRLTTRGNLLTLDGLDLPPGPLYGKLQRGTLAASGQYDLTSGDWNAYVAGHGWPITPADRTPADFTIDLSGTRAWAHLKDLFIQGDGAQVWAQGDIAYRAQGMPAELHVYGWYPPLDYTWHEREGAADDDVRLTGRLNSELHLTKGAWPVNLDVHGTLYAKQLRVKDHPVGDVAMNIEGFADPERLHVATTRLELFNGIWGLWADYRYGERLTKLELSLKDLSLAQLDNFAAPPPNLRGVLSGRWLINLPQFDLNRMTVEGDYTINNLALFTPPPPTTSPAVAAALDKPTTTASTLPATTPTTTPAGGERAQRVEPVNPFATTQALATTAPATQPALRTIARLVTGKVNAADGVISFDPILLERRSGRTRAKASFPVNAPRLVHVEANLAAWPVDLSAARGRGPSNVLLWGRTALDLDLKHLTAAGPLSLHANVATDGRVVADFDVDAHLSQRRIDLRSIAGEGLGGHIGGDGYIYLDSPLQSTGRVDWQDVDAQSVIAFVPALAGLAGKYSGSVRFGPTDRRTDPDATGPFTIGGRFTTAANATYNGLTLGDASFVAYLDNQRAVLDRLVWNVAGGTMKGWTRFTWYDQDPFVHVNLAFDKLNLDEIVRAARPPGQEHKPIPGLLAGSVIAAANPFTEQGRKSASGEARVTLTESDLANVAAVDLLYAVMSVKYGKATPTGRGFATARLEGERLEIPAIRYTNRGIDLWANAAVVNLFKGPESPIEGSAAGSARPLRDLKLPFMADIDKITSALQGGLATVALQGTVGNPNPKVIPFASSGDAFRRFMVGEVKNEVRGTAGQ